MKPILAVTEYTEDKHRYKLAVKGGLHNIRGNHAPYFTITADLYEASGGMWRHAGGGCMHEGIEAKFPGRFSDLIAMHLSDDKGVPMHFEANGWYNLAGALGGAGERYHVGNSDHHFPVTPPSDKPWQNTEYRKPTEADCLAFFAKHCRISVDEAERIADDVRAAFGPEAESETEPAHNAADYKRGREVWARQANGMLGRFQAEAKACIERHNLVVFGDV